MSNTDRGTPLYLPLQKENGLRPTTKILLSALIKAYPVQYFEHKKLYEIENFKINKHPVEPHGPLFYPSTSFAAFQNLVGLSF